MDTEILLDHRPVPGLDGPDFGPGPASDPHGPADGSHGPADGPMGSDSFHLVRVLLRISGEAPEAEGRTPLNLSLVLDRSGSMAGGKIEAAKDAAADLLRRLHPDDVASVVAYDHAVHTVAEPGRGADHDRVADRIRAIGPGGSTNLSGGWLRGRELVRSALADDGLNRVILLSDGLANQGITDPDRMLRLCAESRRAGISTTTVGIGEGFDEDLMRGMADAGGGSAYYVERPDQAGGVFAEELEGLVSLAAQNVTVDVRPGDGARIGRVRHGYRREPIDGGLRLLPGDLYAREPIPLLVEMGVRAGPEGEEVEVADLTIRADVLTPGGGMESRTIELPVRFSPGDGVTVHPEIQRESLLQDAARAREEALEARERGDYGAASDALRSASNVLRESELHDLLSDEEAADLAEEASDLEGMARVAESGGYTEADIKYMKQRAYDSSSGRAWRKELYRREQKEATPESADTPAGDDTPR